MIPQIMIIIKIMKNLPMGDVSTHPLFWWWFQSDFFLDKLPPEILAAEVEYNVRLNDTICLPCAFKVQYKGEYRILSYWQKSKSPVLSWPRYTLKTDCLEIKNIRSVDHGKYTCIAENKLGKTSAVRRLNVLNRIPGKLPGRFTG